MKLVRQLLLVFLFSSSLLLAQTSTGTIDGTVRDSSAAVVAGANVTVTNLDTGIKRVVTSDEAGRYHAPQLLPGSYQIEARSPGFQTEVRKGIQVTVGSNLAINLTLQVGQIEQTTVVTAEAPLVEATTSSLSALVDDKTIRDLPLNGRSFDQLISLESSAPTIRLRGQTTLTGMSDAFSVSGARTQSNLFLMDGTELAGAGSITTQPGGVLGKNLGVDAVREFSVMTSNYSAAYGKRAGGIINLATRSGTNEFHGSAFEFLRNDNLDARNFFDRDPNDPLHRSSPPEFKRNQFGGSLGGPIKKDQTFFFANFEALREGLGLTNIAIVPDADAHNGILPLAASNCASASGTATADGRCQVPVAASVKPYLAAIFPLPNSTNFKDGTAQYLSNPTKVSHQDFFLTRLDHKFSEKDSIFGRYNYTIGDLLSPDQIPLFAEKDNSHDQVFTIEEKHIFSPTLLNTFRFGYSRGRTFTNDLPVVPLDSSLAFLPGQDTVGQITFTSSTVGGGTISQTGTGTSVNRAFVVNDFDYTDQVFIYRGSHSIQVGAQVQRIQHNENFQNSVRGLFQFADLLSFLQAKPTLFRAPSQTGTGDATKAYRQIYSGIYLQDDYKIRPTLTLNLGLRYDLMTVPVEASGNRISNFRTHIDPVTGLQTVDTIPTVGSPFYKGHHDVFAPRVGFAWDVRGDGKTAVRGGFGMFYDQVENEFRFFTANNAPFFSLLSLSNPPFPLGFSGATGSASTPQPDGIDYNLDVPTRLSYNLTVQRQITPSTVFSIGYVGSNANHLTRQTDQNTTVPDLTQLANGVVFYLSSNPRRNPALAGSRIISSDATASYQSLQTEFTKRMSQGLRAKVSFTWAKNIDDASVVISQHAAGNTNATENPFNRHSDRGLSAFDLGRNLVLNLTYDLPGSHLRGAAGKALGGWQMASIVTLSDGTPLSILTGFSRSNDKARSISDRPNLAPGASSNPISGTFQGCAATSGILTPGSPLGTPDLYFDPCAFTVPAAGFYGNLGRDTVIGPGYADMDFTLVKDTAINERLKTEFRAEVFNLLNRANFGLPNNNVFTAPLSSSASPSLLGSVGNISNTVNPSRQLQFSLKLLF